jgi:PDZ domain
VKSGRTLSIVLGIASFIAAPAFAQQSSPQQNSITASQAPLTNKDVLAMQNSGLGTEIIVAKIKSSICDFDTSPAALEQLRDTKLPDEIILAMVQAPVSKSSESGSEQPQPTAARNAMPQPRSYLGLLIVNAAPPADGLLVKSVAPSGPGASAGIREGDVIEAVDGQPIISVSDYAAKVSPLNPGTQVNLKILRNGQENNITATTVPASPELVTVVKSIAYKSLPYYTKTVYQISPGSSNTTCNGSTYGNIDATAQPNYGGSTNISGTMDSNTTTDCNTTYHPPQQGEINWRTVYNYNLLEGGGYRFVVLCTASVRWSKCAYLVPGGFFAAEVKGGQMWITAYKNGNSKKPERVKYDIVQVVPAQ